MLCLHHCVLTSLWLWPVIPYHLIRSFFLSKLFHFQQLDFSKSLLEMRPRPICFHNILVSTTSVSPMSHWIKAEQIFQVLVWWDTKLLSHWYLWYTIQRPKSVTHRTQQNESSAEYWLHLPAANFKIYLPSINKYKAAKRSFRFGDKEDLRRIRSLQLYAIVFFSSFYIWGHWHKKRLGRPAGITMNLEPTFLNSSFFDSDAQKEQLILLPI